MSGYCSTLVSLSAVEAPVLSATVSTTLVSARASALPDS